VTPWRCNVRVLPACRWASSTTAPREPSARRCCIETSGRMRWHKGQLCCLWNGNWEGQPDGKLLRMRGESRHHGTARVTVERTPPLCVDDRQGIRVCILGQCRAAPREQRPAIPWRRRALPRTRRAFPSRLPFRVPFSNDTGWKPSLCVAAGNPRVSARFHSQASNAGSGNRKGKAGAI